MSENKMPKYKSELRQGIGDNIKVIKNSFALKRLYIISDILRRQNDEEAYKSLTDAEYDAASIIRAVINCKDAGRLRKLRAFVNAFLSDDKRKAGAASGVKRSIRNISG